MAKPNKGFVPVTSFYLDILNFAREEQTPIHFTAENWLKIENRR